MNIQVDAKIAKALRVNEKSPDLDNLKIDLADVTIPRPGPGQVLVEIVAAGVNPSDVKASLGHMPHAIWPRTPGRDFGGVVRLHDLETVATKVLGQQGSQLGLVVDEQHGGRGGV